MSMRTLPLVVINLGGEMLYILDQRLKENGSTEDGSHKSLWTEADRRRVLADVVGTMFSRPFMDELFQPQQLYSHRTMKTVLTRIAHASIMRLNPASMDRLYELTVMAFKHQIFLCPRPKDLLLISHNHLDTVSDLVQHTPAIRNQVHEVQRRVIELYTSLPPGEMQLLRQTLLIFFQDHHIRVSLFLKSHIQSPNGRFVFPTSGPVPQGVEVPGLIRTFDLGGREVQRRGFPPGGAFTCSMADGSFELSGDRVLRLGTNIYAAVDPEETLTAKPPSVKTESGPNPLAKEELNLLSRLMGTLKSGSESGSGPRASDHSFRINLFPSDREEDEAFSEGGADPSGSSVIHIQAMKDGEAASELDLILGQFTETEETKDQPCTKGDELLALMDDLC